MQNILVSPTHPIYWERAAPRRPFSISMIIGVNVTTFWREIRLPPGPASLKFWAAFCKFKKPNNSLINRRNCCTRGHSRHMLFLWSQVMSRIISRASTVKKNGKMATCKNKTRIHAENRQIWDRRGCFPLSISIFPLFHERMLTPMYDICIE